MEPLTLTGPGKHFSKSIHLLAANILEFLEQQQEMRGLFGQKLDESLPAVNWKKEKCFLFSKSFVIVVVAVVGNAFKGRVTATMQRAESSQSCSHYIAPHFYNS